MNVQRILTPVLMVAALLVAHAEPGLAGTLRIVEEPVAVDGIMADRNVLWASSPGWLSYNFGFPKGGFSGATAFGGASGGPMILGPDGNVWLAEYAANKVWKLDYKTDIVVPFSVGAGPIALCAGPDGNVWIAEEQAGKIARLTPAGVLTEFTIPTAFSHPTSIVASLGDLWFTESNTNKIGRVTPTGEFTEWVVPRANSVPMGITDAGRGDLYFTEAYTHRVTRFYSDSSSFSQSYALPTANASPRSIVATTNGDVWFIEHAANQIGRLYKGVVTEYPIPTPASGASQLVDMGDGTLAFLERDAGKLARVFASVPGDVNADGETNVTDVFYLIGYLFAGGPAPVF